jgi:hypothetical protein
MDIKKSYAQKAKNIAKWSNLDSKMQRNNGKGLANSHDYIKYLDRYIARAEDDRDDEQYTLKNKITDPAPYLRSQYTKYITENDKILYLNKIKTEELAENETTVYNNARRLIGEDRINEGYNVITSTSKGFYLLDDIYKKIALFVELNSGNDIQYYLDKRDTLLLNIDSVKLDATIAKSPILLRLLDDVKDTLTDEWVKKQHELSSFDGQVKNIKQNEVSSIDTQVNNINKQIRNIQSRLPVTAPETPKKRSWKNFLSRKPKGGTRKNKKSRSQKKTKTNRRK